MALPRTQTYGLVPLSLLIGATLLTGCSNSNKGVDWEPYNPNEPVKLKIMYPSSNVFNQRYGNQLAAKYPNIEFEVIPPPLSSGMIIKSEDMIKQIKEEAPDIITVSTPLYETLVKEGQLVDLDPIIRQDQFDIADIHSSVIDSLRGEEGGPLYGLAPSFSANALYYNADLFRKYGVDLPTDRMTWEDLLKLSMRFPTDGADSERIYGFQTGISQNLASLVDSIATTNGLTPISSDGKSVVVNTDSWRYIIERVLLAHDSLLMAKGTTIDELFQSSVFSPDQDPFLNGRVAMKVDHFGYYQNFDFVKKANPNYKPFKWDVVTVPVNPLTPDTTSPMLLGSIFSINSKSAHKSAAWEVIKYINGEEVAKLESKTLTVDIPARKAYAQKKDELNVEPFFALKPAVRSWNAKKWPEGFGKPFSELFSEQLEEVRDGKKTLDDALKTIQNEGQKILMSLEKKSDSRD